MAEIQIEYTVRSCRKCREQFCMQCATVACPDIGCPGYESEMDVDWGGACKNILSETAYKGFFTKSYEAERFFDPYNPNLACMKVTVRGRTYYCDKVILDGVQIYPHDPDEAPNAPGHPFCEWIPVGKYLPGEGTPVLAWEAQGFVYVDRLVDGKWEIADNNCGTVFFWMPLPEPPKEGI